MSDELEEFVSRLPKKQTPSNSAEDLFEIQHTGEWNYQVEGGGTKIFIDGYRGRIILEAKYIYYPERSPYIPSSKIPEFLRRKILQQMRDEFQRIGNVINDPTNLFNSLEVITNNPEAKSLFEEFIKELNIPGSVVIPE
jgi:hypothetical protein